MLEDCTYTPVLNCALANPMLGRGWANGVEWNIKRPAGARASSQRAKSTPNLLKGQPARPLFSSIAKNDPLIVLYSLISLLVVPLAVHTSFYIFPYPAHLPDLSRHPSGQPHRARHCQFRRHPHRDRESCWLFEVCSDLGSF